MKNRKFSELSDIDQLIRKNLSTGMEDGTKLTIELICGFELFGGYETWSEGYKVTGPIGPVGYGWINSEKITVKSKNLDDALNEFFKLRKQKKDEYEATHKAVEGRNVWEDIK